MSQETAPLSDHAPGEPRPAVLGLRLVLFYFTLFAVIGVHMPFWPVWLESRALTAAEIGILLSAKFWVKVVGNPLAGHLVDRRGERRTVMTALAALSLATFALFWFAQGFWALLLLSLLAGGLFAALVPLGENLTMLNAYTHKLDYGRVRLWGSLSFIASAGGAGLVLTDSHPDTVLLMIATGLLFTIPACLLLPDRRTGRTDSPMVSARPTLGHGLFVVFLLSSALLQSSHAVYYGFSALHWQAAGLSSATIGWLWGVGVLAEILLFAFSAPVLLRLGPAQLLLLAALGGLVRWTVMAFSADIFILAVTQCLHALTFGASHLAAMHFIARATPPQVSGRVQAVYSSITMGAAMGLAMLASGSLYGAFGGHAFLFGSLLALTGGLLALVLLKGWDGGRLAPETTAQHKA